MPGGTAHAVAYRGRVPPASSLFVSINEFARSTPWLHSTAAAYATYGILVFAVLIALRAASSALPF